MKIITLIFLVFINNNIFPHEILNNEELIFENNSSKDIEIKIYPIGMIFNGDNEYNLVAKKRSNPNSTFNKADYIGNVFYFNDSIFRAFKVGSTSKGLEFDPDGGSVSNIFGIYSHGLYKINLKGAFLDSIILEMDASELINDLFILFYNDSIIYQVTGYPRIKLTSDSYKIESWKPEGPSQNTQKNFGNLNYSYGTESNPVLSKINLISQKRFKTILFWTDYFQFSKQSL